MNYKINHLIKQKKKFSLKKKKPLKWVIIIVTIIMSIYLFFKMLVMVSQVTIFEFLISAMPQKIHKGINILAFGIDETKNVKRADSIMLIHVDPTENRINILSIPRDTRLHVEKIGLTKVNHAYAYGNISLLKESISNLTGLPIHFHIKTKLNDVKNIIDSIGGVEINIEKDLFYEDKAGGLYIDIKKGTQVLNGDKAIQYLRYRQDKQGDIGRIHRQQKLLKSINETLNKKGKLLQLPVFIRKLSKLIKTDLSLKEMFSLSSIIIDVVRDGKIEKETVPGKITLMEGVSYWQPDISKMDEIIKTKIIRKTNTPENKYQIQTADKEASQENRRKITLKEISRVAEQIDLKENKKNVFEDLRIEILNGIGKSGEALKAAKLLKNKKLNVVKFDNAGSYNYEKTLLVDWKGNIDKLISLASYLKIDPNNIIVYDRKNKALEATLVLGKDWDTIKEKLIKNE